MRICIRIWICSAALLIAAPAAGWEHQVSERGAKLSWKTTQLTWRVDGTIPGGDDAVVDAAVHQWTRPGCSRLTLVRRAGGRIVIRHVPAEKWTRRRGLAAWTDVRSSGLRGRILSVEILLNGHHRFSTAPRTPPDTVDLASTITHELGHALGFAHSRVADAVMHAGIRPGEQRRTLHTDDVAAVCAVYGVSRSRLPR